MEPWTQFHSHLRDVLASLFSTRQKVEEITLEAGMDPTDIDLDGSARAMWFHVVRYALSHEMIAELIDAVRSQAPRSVALKNVIDRNLSAVESPADVYEIPWKSDVSQEQLEKLISSENTLLPIGFLEVGLERAKSVCRIQTVDAKGRPAYGTGFLLKNNWVLTNHHVLSSADQAAAALVQFNFELTGSGLEKAAIPFRIQSESGGFHTSKDDDWTLVRLADNANADWGAITLKPASIARSNRVIIIQHPSGGPKQIALSHNLVTYSDSRVVHYLTDTLPGSSGSPVFDEQWNVVALHHSGGWLREPGSKAELFRNEGIAIGRVLEGVGDLLTA